jgi:DNA modification methylase
MTSLLDGRVTLIQGDCLEVLDALPAKSVHCVVTSPPYFALRSYLPAGHADKGREIGSEPTPAAFIATMVEVFRKVKRVLRDDGTIFVNLGDGYAASGKGGNPDESPHRKQATNAGSLVDGRPIPDGYRAGDIMNIPHRVAEALRADGWIWRQTVVWAKRSPMPESVGGWRWQRCRVKVKAGTVPRIGDPTIPRPVTGHRNFSDFAPSDFSKPEALAQWRDCPGCQKCLPNGGYILRRGKGRCTTAHEYIFIMSKKATYFWDSAASAEGSLGERRRAGTSSQKNKAEGLRSDKFPAPDGSTTRNPRSVWTLSSEPTKVRHFATFPSELVRRCLVAGVSAGGCCLKCGAPWAPVVDSERVPTQPALANKAYAAGEMPNLDPERHVAVTKCHGYRPTCGCGCAEPGRSVVLDPFGGIGTTVQTAMALGHSAISIDLNPEYHAVACERVKQPPRWLLRRRADKPSATERFAVEDDAPLFTVTP